MARLKRPPSNGPRGLDKPGRPTDACRALAQKYAFKVLYRQILIARGARLEQVVNGEGETIRIPAKVSDQLKAGDTVLKIARVLTNEIEKTPEDSVKNAEAAFALLKTLQELSRNGTNARDGQGSDTVGVADRRLESQAPETPA